MYVQIESMIEQQETGYVSVDRPTFLIGRGVDADWQVGNRFASRRHCELVVTEDRVLVRDLESSNGTFVNDRRTYRPTEIYDGDLIGVGSEVLKVRVRTSIREPLEAARCNHA